MNVALLPTGRTEWYGLPVALGRLFPGHQFHALPGTTTFQSLRGPYPGFTSARVRSDLPSQAAKELVEIAAQEALGDRARSAADLVVILDDLELVNRDQPAVVVQVVRNAVAEHLKELESQRPSHVRDRTATALQQRVSFHLVVPMIEAWFFGDRDALQTAGLPSDVQPVLVGSSLEDFATNDPAYLQASEHDCPRWRAQRSKKDRPKWLGPERERHPKGYLQWLCRSGEAKNCTSYDETERGASALKGLDWSALLAPGLPHGALSYLAALLEDLAFALGDVSQRLSNHGTTALTCLERRPQDHLLRNI